MTHLRSLLLPAFAALALGAVACGGTDETTERASGETAAASGDVNELLGQAFEENGNAEFKSGKFDVKVAFEGTSGQAKEDMPGGVNLALAGKFVTRATGELPELELTVDGEAVGQSFQVSAISTGEKGYLTWQGTNYVLDGATFRQLTAAYEEAYQQAQKEQDLNFTTLGVDPRNWLIDAKIDGEEQVGGTATTKITGGVDTPKALDDFVKMANKSAEITGEEPTQITDEQRRRIIAAVKNPKVEIYIGKDDQIVRRFVLDLGFDDAESGAGNVSLDVAISELNEPQEIVEPTDARPLSELSGGLGLGGLGGLSLGGGSPS